MTSFPVSVQDTCRAAAWLVLGALAWSWPGPAGAPAAWAQEGESTDATGQPLVLMPTVLLQPDPEEAPDSISFLPLLKNPMAVAPRSSLVMQSTHFYVVRRGPWKLALCPGSGSAGVWGNTRASTKPGKPRGAHSLARPPIRTFAPRPSSSCFTSTGTRARPRTSPHDKRRL